MRIPTFSVLVLLGVGRFVSAPSLLAQNHPPTVVSTQATLNLAGIGASQVIELERIFADSDLLSMAGTQAKFTISLGGSNQAMNIELFDGINPITVQNFVRYITSGRYVGTFWHRSVPNFVIQTGGYSYDGANTMTVPVYPAIPNEFRASNVRGTVAMAKLGGDPNSATSQWFVNLADNSANLDVQNGGFTVFGRVIEGGMSVADGIAALPTYNFGLPFDQLPLQNYSGSGPILVSNVVVVTAVNSGPKVTFSALPAAPSVASFTIQGLRLTVQGSQPGTTSVTLRAVDFNGLSAETTFQVNVGPSLVGITHTASQTGGTFKGLANASYAIDYSDGLVAAWQVLNASMTAGADGMFSFTDLPAGPKRFYRARQLP